MSDGLVHTLAWQCPRCGASEGVDLHEERTQRHSFRFYRCRACDAPVDPTDLTGPIVAPAANPN